MFENIYCYNKVKKEFEELFDWLMNREEYKKLNVVVPKGVILYGPPGSGKTLFMKEIMNNFPNNVYVINGDSEKPMKEVTIAFNKSKEVDFLIILIDELDLLLDHDMHLSRLLQTYMDGLTNYNNTLVIATANILGKINDPLLRRGRFDKHIPLCIPKRDERYDFLKIAFAKRNVNISDDDVNYLSNIMTEVSYAEMISIINDAILRNKSIDITTESIEDSYYISYYGERFEFDKKNNNSKYVAMHEAGHALLAYKHRKYFSFYRATIQMNIRIGGLCKLFEGEEYNSSLEKEIAVIEIKLAGYLANKIIYNYMDSGSSNDLQEAVFLERRLINSLGYKGINRTLRRFEPHVRNETAQSCYKNERICRRELKKAEKRVVKYIKDNKKMLFAIASKLEAKGSITRKEFNEIVKCA